MKITKIFIASSINEFAKERKRLGYFFNRMNNQLINQNMFCDVKFCEELDNAVPEVRKQNEYNEFIRQSNLVIFLLGEACGEYTYEEFKEALNIEKDAHILIFQKSVDSEDNHIASIKEYAVTDDRILIYRYDDYSEIEEEIHKKLQISPKEEEGNYKKIQFFLGTSDKEREEERNEIVRFVLNLNSKLLKHNVYVQFDNSKSNVLSEQLIMDADAAFFVFFATVEDNIRAELDFSLQKFRTLGKPKIYTYFYENQQDDNSILELKKMLDERIQHYYSLFTNVDSIKLSILIQISEIMGQSFKLLMEERSIKLEDNLLLDMKELPVVSKNRTLLKLQNQLAAVDADYREVAEKFREDVTNREWIKRLSDLGDAKEILKEKIHGEEKEIFKMLCEMHRTIAQGEIDELIRSAYRHLEKGEIEEAAQILSKKRVDNIFKDKLQEKKDELHEEAKNAVQMYKHTIRIQKMLDESMETVRTIIECYEEIAGYINAVRELDCMDMVEYAEFLDSQNSLQAERIFEQAEYLYKDPLRNISKESMADLYAKMGSYHMKQYNLEYAERCLKEYYIAVKSLYEEHGQAYALKYSKSCLEYSRINIENKVEILKDGLKVLLQYVDVNDTERNIIILAEYYFESASLYAHINNTDMSIEGLKEGISLLEEHQISNNVLGDLYNNLAEILRQNPKANYSKAQIQKYYEKSICIFEKLYEGEPGKYAKALGDLYNNMCVCFLDFYEGYLQGIKYLKKAKNVYEVIYYKNPYKGAQDLGECYIQMSNVYDSLKNPKRAFDAAKEGIKIFEDLFEYNPNRYAIKMAWAYSEIGLLYCLQNNFDECTYLIEKSLDVLENTENEYLQMQQSEIMIKIFAVLTNMAQNIDAAKGFFRLGHRSFDFAYTYMKKDLEKTYPEFIELLFSMGQTLMHYYEKEDLSFAKEYYYPKVFELGQARLKDKSMLADFFMTDEVQKIYQQDSQISKNKHKKKYKKKKR